MPTELATRPIADLARRSAAEERQYRQGAPVDESASLELFRRAIEQRDDLAWEQIYQQWKSLLLHWLFQHPAAELALEQESPESYVTAALSRFWQATTHTHRSKQGFSSLGGTLAYLRCCLNSVVLDAARQTHARQHEVYADAVVEDLDCPEPEPFAGDLWSGIERALPERRERLLVYLRYVQGYRPREVVAAYPQEFPSASEVYRLERNLLERLSRHPALAGWKEGAAT